MEETRLSNNITEEKKHENVRSIIKGSVFSIIISVILLMIYAILLSYTNLSEKSMNVIIIVISGISILMGSSISSLKVKKQGMFTGAIVGIIYMLILYILSSIVVTGFHFNMNSIIMIFVGIITGMIGGIIGVNL